MICEKCKNAELKSTIREYGAGTITCAYYQPWYDEDGNYHNHDGNSMSHKMICSNGHRWVMSGNNNFCACGWKGPGITTTWLDDIDTTKPYILI